MIVSRLVIRLHRRVVCDAFYVGRARPRACLVEQRIQNRRADSRARRGQRLPYEAVGGEKSLYLGRTPLGRLGAPRIPVHNEPWGRIRTGVMISTASSPRPKSFVTLDNDGDRGAQRANIAMSSTLALMSRRSPHGSVVRRRGEGFVFRLVIRLQESVCYRQRAPCVLIFRAKVLLEQATLAVRGVFSSPRTPTRSVSRSESGACSRTVHREGSNLAMTSGRLAAEPIFPIKSGRDPMTAENLGLYKKMLDDSFRHQGSEETQGHAGADAHSIAELLPAVK
jgi:hypothetical protein